MKVPKYIVNEMHNVAKYSTKMTESMNIVELWLEKNGVYTTAGESFIRSGDGYSLEELEYGNDVTDLIVERLENHDY